MALLGKTPFLRYYGDHSASALFLIGLADAYARSGSAGWFRERRDLALRTLDWMDRYGDLDGDGLYEYRTFAGRHGLKNQGWKDSNEAILHPDGVLVPDPIVVCEIQALFAAAKQAMAAAFESAGEDALARDLAGQAEQARRLFEQTMWMEDEGFLAMGLDPDKRQIRTLASNAGESLAYGPLDEAKARRVADRLMRPDFFTGWGLRTLTASHPAYNPLGYHLGSVWPCFSALTARGFARYGFVEHCHTLTRALFEATTLFDHHRLPELFGGHARDEADRPPGLYPEACWPQAWSSGAIILLVDTLVGLKPAAPLGAVLVEPKLPPWLPRASLAGIRLGAGRLDLNVDRRPNGDMLCQVGANSTGLRVFGPGLQAPSPAEAEALRAYVGSLP
jgi:glycogen debranching enzyme